MEAGLTGEADRPGAARLAGLRVDGFARFFSYSDWIAREAEKVQKAQSLEQVDLQGGTCAVFRSQPGGVVWEEFPGCSGRYSTIGASGCRQREGEALYLWADHEERRRNRCCRWRRSKRRKRPGDHISPGRWLFYVRQKEGSQSLPAGRLLPLVSTKETTF